MRHPPPKFFFLWLMAFLFAAVSCQAANGEYVFFIAATDQSWQVFQIDQGGTNLSQIARCQYDALHVSAVTGQQNLLLICTDRNPYLIDLKTKNKSRLKTGMNGATDAVLSGDNKSLLFSLSTGGSNDANHIWLTDIPTGKSRQLTRMKNMQHNPIWSREGKYIFFLSGDGGQSEDIWRLELETGSLRQLTVGKHYNFDLAYSMNDEIAFSSNRSGNYEIWTMDPFGGNVRQLTHNPSMDSQPSWSPDGEHLVFVSTRDGEPALYIMDREGENTHRLTPEGLLCRNPVWSR